MVFCFSTVSICFGMSKLVVARDVFFTFSVRSARQITLTSSAAAAAAAARIHFIPTVPMEKWFMQTWACDVILRLCSFLLFLLPFHLSLLLLFSGFWRMAWDDWGIVSC